MKKKQRLCAIYYFKGRKLGIWIKHLGILTQKYLATLGEEREKSRLTAYMQIDVVNR